MLCRVDYRFMSTACEYPSPAEGAHWGNRAVGAALEIAAIEFFSSVSESVSSWGVRGGGGIGRCDDSSGRLGAGSHSQLLAERAPAPVLAAELLPHLLR